MGVFGCGVFQLCICLYARNVAAVGYIVVAVGSLTERRLFRVRLNYAYERVTIRIRNFYHYRKIRAD